MVFPQTVQDIKTELELDSVWTDISADVRRDPGVTIKRGRSDENRKIEPSSCSFALDNSTGNYSPRNPLSIYYGVIGRNTPVRVSVLGTESLLHTNQQTGTTVGASSVSTPDTAALDIVGDIDLRFEADFDSWRDAVELISKWTESGNQRSYLFSVSSTGTLRMRTSVDGTAIILSESTAAIPIQYGRLTVRATVDVNNGAGGNTVTFYTGAGGVDGSFTQLGDPVVNAGVTSLFSSSSIVYVLDNPLSALGALSIGGTVRHAQIRSSIAGAVVANPDFTIQAEGATSFVDSAGLTWTVNGTAAITLRDFRFRGEISAWPQEWDQSGSNVYSTVEAAGITRRLGQGVSPVPSSLRRSVSAFSTNVAYWPCEDGELSTTMGSAHPNGKPMTITGTPELAANSDLLSSLPLPILRLASFTGIIRPYTTTNSMQARFYLSLPAAGIAHGTIIANLATTGTARRFELQYRTGGALRLNTYDVDDVALDTDADQAFLLDGRPAYIIMNISDNGTGVDVNIYTIDVVTEVLLASSVTTVASAQAGRASKIIINPELRMDDVVVGHISVTSDAPAIGGDIGASLRAWVGEEAGSRIKRLAGENSIPFFGLGDMEDSAQLGPQLIKTALELIQEAADSDLGILYEPRDQYGLTYRTRTSLNNQAATVTFDYSANELNSFQPIDDDQNTINDITLTRIGGSNYRAVDETSALSTQQPPNGVGIYDDSPSISLFEDDQLPDQAGWRLHLGIIDEARYPVIGFNMTSPSFLAVVAHTAELFYLDVGDRLVVTDSPAWLPPDDVQQLAQGFTEYLANFERSIEINCSPASPWEIARYAEATSSGANQYKYSSDGTVTTEALDTTETGIDVTTASGPVWTTEAAQMPIDIIIGGERMSITAVTGTTANQVFTVTRSVNGIVKSHSTGAVVELFRPAVYTY